MWISSCLKFGYEQSPLKIIAKHPFFNINLASYIVTRQYYQVLNIYILEHEDVDKDK